MVPILLSRLSLTLWTTFVNLKEFSRTSSISLLLLSFSIFGMKGIIGFIGTGKLSLA